MSEQVEKLFGLIVLGIAGVIMVVFGLIFHVLPALVLLSFLSLVLTSIVYFITLEIFNFQILWLIFTIILFIGVHMNSRKIEYDIRKSVAEDDEL